MLAGPVPRLQAGSPGPRAPPPTAYRGACCMAVCCWVSAPPRRGPATGRSPDAAARRHHKPPSTGRWDGQGNGSGRGQGLRTPHPHPIPSRDPRPHLPPGRDVPAEAGLHPAGTAGGRHGRPRLAVEGPQRPEVLCVHALHVPHRGPSATAAGALQAREHGVSRPHARTRPHGSVRGGRSGWGQTSTPCPGEPASLRLQVRSQGRHRRAQDDREEQGSGGDNEIRGWGVQRKGQSQQRRGSRQVRPTQGEARGQQKEPKDGGAEPPQPAPGSVRTRLAPRAPRTLLQFPVCQAAQGLRWQRRAGWGRPAAAQSSSRPELQRTGLQTAPRPQVVEHWGPGHRHEGGHIPFTPRAPRPRLAHRGGRDPGGARASHSPSAEWAPPPTTQGN